MKPGELAKIRERIILLEEEFTAANPGVAVQRLPPPDSSKGFGSGGSKGVGGGGGGKGFSGGGKGFGAKR